MALALNYVSYGAIRVHALTVGTHKEISGCDMQGTELRMHPQCDGWAHPTTERRVTGIANSATATGNVWDDRRDSPFMGS